MPPGRLFTHRNCLAIKWPRGAWLLLSGMWPHAGIKQHVTNIFQLQFSWVLLGAHKIQEYCHVLGQLSSTATAVSCNMWQLSKTFAQSGPSNIHQASRCQSEIQWIQIFKLDPLYFAYILHICSHHNCKCAWSQAIDTAGVEQEWIFSPSFAYKVTIWSWQFKKHFLVRSSCQEIQGWSRNVTPSPEVEVSKLQGEYQLLCCPLREQRSPSSTLPSSRELLRSVPSFLPKIVWPFASAAICVRLKEELRLLEREGLDGGIPPWEGQTPAPSTKRWEALEISGSSRICCWRNLRALLHYRVRLQPHQ